MKLALFSDLHANLPALHACLQHAQTQGADQWAFLGDLVGYGGTPGAVLDVVMQAVERGAWIVGGNHDALALHPPAHITHRGEQGALWTHAQLRPDHLDFLRQLPLMQHHDTVLLVHASADRPGRWTYVDQPIHAERSLAAAAALDGRIRYVFSGHVHVQSLYFRTRTGPLMAFAPQPQVPISVPAHRQWLAIVGACGQPRDGDPRAMYALFDADQSQLTFHRVPYDVEAAMQAIARSGQPLAFAHRLESGQ